MTVSEASPAARRQRDAGGEISDSTMSTETKDSSPDSQGVEGRAKGTVLVMAGGTGGHIFPALATAAELQSRGYRIHWLGTPGSMEAELVPAHGYDISFLPVTGLRGKGLSFLVKAPWKVTVSVLRAMKALRQYRPVCVLGMGGYVTGPGGVAARLLGVPLVIHEQNAVAGLTNKLLARVASRVLEAFPGTFARAGMQLDKVYHAGNPVRGDIESSSAPVAYSGTSALKVLVLGGSRGAVAINEVVPAALSVLNQEKDGITTGTIAVWHQTGKGNYEATRKAYQQKGIDAKVEPFINDMAAAYTWADLVLCRSGALTVSELAIAGRPAILVPYPHAVDDHQTVNGSYLVEQGAALMVQQNELSKESLAEMFKELSGNHRQLQAMAEAARSVARPQATREVADHCLEVCHA
ncbi:MAG: undecaprenyldiphospho-muramoylpentapeptide beta-N-acetylglucosaminyltransferase [Endozoicomonas sp.]